jgi:hypothetical protein
MSKIIWAAKGTTTFAGTEQIPTRTFSNPWKITLQLPLLRLSASIVRLVQ